MQLQPSLANPNTVAVYDYGRTPEGAFYYVMEYLDGIDLERLVRRDRAAAGRSRRARPAAGVRGPRRGARHGLSIATSSRRTSSLRSSAAIPDFAKVVDFGLVKDVLGSQDARLTREGVFAGTLHYLSPEAIREAGSLDPRSDLYALGAVAYYMLTATRVFEGRAIDVIQAHLDAPPEPPSQRLGRPIPAKLESVVLDCLAKDPNLRPESAAVLADRLAACDDVTPWTAEQARAWWKARKTA